MPLTSAGKISLQDIKNEFGDPDGDGQFKFSEYYRGDSSSKPVKDITSNQNISTSGEIRASQFYSSAGIFLPGETDANSGWPDNNFGVIGGTSSSNGNWVPQEYHYQAYSIPQAWATMSFVHQPGNSRMKCQWETGHSGRGSTIGIGYFNYAGLETATWQVKYDVDSQSYFGDSSYLAFGPLPTDNGRNPGVFLDCTSAFTLFGWQAQASAGNRNARVFVTNLSFTLQATLGADVLTTTFNVQNAGFGGMIGESDYPMPMGKGLALAVDYRNTPIESGK